MYPFYLLPILTPPPPIHKSSTCRIIHASLGSYFGVNPHTEMEIGAHVPIAEKMKVSFTLIPFIIFESSDWNFDLVPACLRAFEDTSLNKSLSFLNLQKIHDSIITRINVLCLD